MVPENVKQQITNHAQMDILVTLIWCSHQVSKVSFDNDALLVMTMFTEILMEKISLKKFKRQVEKKEHVHLLSLQGK